MILTLQKRSPAWYLCAWLFLLPLFLGIFTDFLGLPGALRYSADAAWCGLALQALLRGRLRLDRQLLPQACTAAAFFLLTLAVILFRFQSIALYLWGSRNNFRFYAAFFAFAACLDRRDAARFFRLLEGLFWLNFAVTLIQFFRGYQQDFLGGIFGVERGRNAAYTVIFFLLVLSRSLLEMMEGREPLSRCLCKCGAALLTAALAEMFAFFLMFGLIFVMAALLTRFSWKKCLLFLLLAAATAAGSSLLLELFGEGSRLTPEIVFRRLFAQNYASHQDLGRLTAIPTLCRTLVTSLPDRLFGLGLGNCDTSSFAVCSSPFYQTYSHLHYTWFLSAFLFLETGFLGLGLYLLFFLLCFLGAARRKADPLARLGMILAVMCVVLTFYNSALRSEAGYLAFFGLALPFVRQERRDP